ncbi:MAG: ATP-binding protein [Candidatus Magnetomorum sp.]|nr:ATP-binding protein [Candidatus Magnetomorum sp.]
MFVNREKELDTLKREYSKDAAAFSVIFGRRRMGKTTLISRYIQNKRALYYYATEVRGRQHIEQLTLQIMRFLNKPHLHDLQFSDMEQLLIFFSEQLPQEQKIIFAIDEYQEIVKVIPEFSSILQKVWDLHFKSKNIHLILCGSVISMMHSETLAYDAPLYGRRTSNIHLKPMKFINIKDFIPSISLEDAIRIYASFGTVPKYLELYDEHLDFMENIQQSILNKDAYLYQEVKYLLKEEKGDGPTYFSIIQTIAMGEKKIGNIAKRLQMPSNHLTRYLMKLIDLDIIEKEVPITEKNPLKSKLGRYRIIDRFIDFWFFYVYKNTSLLEIGQYRYVLDEIEKTFNQRFVSFAFEDYVKELIMENPMQYLGFVPLKMGRWWSKNAEIDLVAIGEDSIALIECKWQNQPVDIHTYQEMIQKSQYIEHSTPLTFILFSKNGFHSSLKDIPNLRTYSYL